MLALAGPGRVLPLVLCSLTLASAVNPVRNPHELKAEAITPHLLQPNNASVFGGAFSVQLPGTSAPLTWLKHTWVTSPQDLREFKAFYMRHITTDDQDPAVHIDQDRAVRIEDGGGIFAGRQRFMEALMKDVPGDLAAELARCPLASMGGRTTNAWVRPPSLGHGGRVWIFVNGETSPGEEFWHMMKDFLLPGDRGVILGNWWNGTHETYQSSEVSSLWVPFASTSFAERRHKTPMDLVERGRQACFTRERKHLVAYQQRGCVMFREVFWDMLNQELAKQGLQGSAISTCNGKNESGERLLVPEDGGYPQGAFHDHAMGRYEGFRFAWAAEHCQNNHGYISEKIVSAFLAGAVPIYGGAATSQVREMFEPNSFLTVDLNSIISAYIALTRATGAMADNVKYERLLHRSQPVVSDDAMRRFFSWHPAVWGVYGDGLRRQILEEVLRLCRAVS